MEDRGRKINIAWQLSEECQRCCEAYNRFAPEARRTCEKTGKTLTVKSIEENRVSNKVMQLLLGNESAVHVPTKL